MVVRIQSLLSGVISCLPGGNERLFSRYRDRKPNTGTSNARYCYSVWLRHLVLANKHRLTNGVPNAIAELGPGNSLGSGLAGLISGAKRYYAFDVVHHVKNEENINIFDELVSLFEKREDIPSNKEFPQINTELDDYNFPSNILNDDVLECALNKERITEIRNEIVSAEETTSNSSIISYVVPWYDINVVSEGTIDMIFSKSVLEHIDDLQLTYQTCFSWLKKGGFMSHEIDFTCHGHSAKWNGHWGYSDFIWRIIRGRRPYLINRNPHSSHVNLLMENGFEIVVDTPKYDSSGIKRHELARRFKYLSDDDIRIRNAFLLSTKK